MQQRHYKTILYFISTVILITIAMQGYWVYKNYQAGKQQLVNEVQISLDNAINSYYANRAEETFEAYAFFGGDQITNTTLDSESLDSIFSRFKRIDSLSKYSDSHVKINIDVSKNSGDTVTIFKEIQSVSGDTIYKNFNLGEKFPKKIKNDTIFNHPLAKLTSRVLYGLTENAINLNVVDSLLVEELERKKIDVNYQLRYKQPFLEEQTTGDLIRSSSSILNTTSRSEFLPKKTQIDIDFTNITGTILKRNLVGLLFSLVFVIAIITTLLYLLKIIKSQKQLAEVKNDLISNITHEFKTPLATIGAAMEGIQLFNKNNDTEKTLKYAKISSTQVNKLTTMVEKLLETATLDGEQLELNFEQTDLVKLLETISKKEAFISHQKTITFKTTETVCEFSIDAFHFENAINNIIDNAIKYGGETIEITLKKGAHTIEIEINDNGHQLTHEQSKQIFEKFYRVPKGNTHDIKGFGIGLYYTKAIIEKHNGTIDVFIKPTIFKITLPNG